jgi:hypothetical protein
MIEKPYIGYKPLDLSQNPNFNPLRFKDIFAVNIPSQGADRDEVLNKEGEMAYEQRQYSLSMSKRGGLFLTRRPFPSAEKEYWQKLFQNSSDKLPEELIISFKSSYLNTPLDRILLSEEEYIDAIKDYIERNGNADITLISFNQTSYIEKLAEILGLNYYGNAAFAEWAGTKTGLIDFAAECKVPTPPTYRVGDFADIYDDAEKLAELGFTEIVIKMDHSTGGMGHKRMQLGRALKFAEGGFYENILPDQYKSKEGAIIQGWMPDSISLSLAIFVNFDGTYEFTGAQIHELKKGNAFSAVGAYPIGDKYLDKLLEYGHRIAKGYVRHKAYGPHTVGFIAPNVDWLKKHSYSPDEIFFNDENSRPGASTISLNWILSLRDGVYGKGWRVSKIPVIKGTNIADVIKQLKAADLLLEEIGPKSHGIFVYGGLILDSGYEDNFFAIAISAKDSFNEASSMIETAKKMFNPEG